MHAKNDIRKLQSASLLCISTDLDCKIHNNVLLAVGNYDILNVLLGRYLETNQQRQERENHAEHTGRFAVQHR